MDLGFGAVLEKFEDYFGRGITKALLVLIGLAVASTCIGAIWEWIVSPILIFFQSPLWSRTIASLVTATLAIGAGVTVGLSISAAFVRWRRTRQLTKLMASAEAQADTMLGEVRELLDDATSRQTNARAIMDASIRMARVALARAQLSKEERDKYLANLELAQEILDEVDTQDTAFMDEAKRPKEG